MSSVVAWALRLARDIARDATEAQMRATVLITRGADPKLLPSGEVEVDPDLEVYRGKARVGAGRGPVTYTIGEEVAFFSTSSCTLPLEVAVQVDDLVTVLAHDDPLYAGRQFRVVDVEVMGEPAVWRRVQLTGAQRYRGWEDETVRHPSLPAAPDTIPADWRVDG